MQKRIIGGIILLLIAGLFVGNWVYGTILSKKIEEGIANRFKLLGDNVEVSLEEVKVNPLFSEIQLIGILVQSVDGELIARGKEVDLDMPYSEAIRMLKSKDFEELKSFCIHVNELAIYIEGAEDQLLVNSLMLDFDGSLTKSDLKNINTVFPTQKQAVKIIAKDMSFANTPWLETLGFTPAQITQFNKVDKLSMDAEFNPNKKILRIDDLNIHSPLMDYDSNGSLKFSGDGLDGMKPKQVKSFIEFKLKEKGIEWGDPQTSGRYTLGNLAVQIEGVVDYEDSTQIIQSQRTNFLLEDLKLEYSGAKKAQLEAQTALLGIKMDQLSISRLAIQSNLADGQLRIKNSELKSSLFNADLNLEVKLDKYDHMASQIIAGKLVVSDLVAGLQNGLSTFELMTGQSLPRNGDDIIIEVSGPISRPNIKGLRY